MNIGIIDADLLDKGSRFPNLALMKISAYHKKLNNNVILLDSYDNISLYDKVYISKVFDFTNTPDLSMYSNVQIGGTGFFGVNAKDLPYEIEHHMPDYHLYDEWAEREIARGIKPSHVSDYLDGSIGFITRGCFRKCEFCVNRKYDKAFKHSPIEEFLDKDRKYIYLWDDNFLAYHNWKEELENLKATGKYFVFRQGLDIRLMTDEKAKALNECKYKGDWIFAFDSIKDKELIENKLRIWKKHCKKQTKLYVLTAYDSQDIEDIVNTLERIKILMKLGCIPFLMRYKDYKDSQFKDMYTQLTRWCNQPNMFKKKSFREFCHANQKYAKTKCLSVKTLEEFEKLYPEIAREYFDLKYEELKEI